MVKPKAKVRTRWPGSPPKRKRAARRDTRPYFSRRMEQLREAKGWNYKELERVAGVTDQTLISIERDGTTPLLPTAVKIARALGVPLTKMIEPA